MTEVQALGGVTTEEFGKMRDAALDLSKQYPVTATDIANAMYLMVSTGYDYQEMMATMPEAARLATAGSMEMAEATNSLINVMGVYGDRAGEASDITRVFANAVGVGKYEMTDFMSEIMKNIGVAAQLGISFSDLAAYNVSLQNSFTNAEEAGTSMNRMLIALTDPSTVAKLKDMGIAVTDNEGNFRDLDVIMGELKVHLSGVGDDAERAGIMTDLFGTYGQRAALAIMNQSENLPELKDKMAELNLIEDQTAVKLQGTSQQLEMATNKMDAAKIALGEGMLPATLMTADAISGLAGVLEDLPGPLQSVGGMAIYAGQGLAIVGPALMGLAALKTLGLGSVLTSIAGGLSGIGTAAESAAAALAGSFTAAVGAGILLGLAGVWVMLKTGILDGFADLGRWISGSTIGAPIMDALRIILAPIGSLGAGIIELVKGNFAGIGPAMMQPLNQAADAVRSFVSSINGMFSQIGNIGGALGGIQSLFSGIGSAFYGMAGQIQGVFSQLMNAILGLINGTAGGFRAAGMNIITSMVNGIIAAAGGIVTAIGNALQAVRSLFPFSPAKEGPLAQVPNWAAYMSEPIAKEAPAAAKAASSVAGAIAGGAPAGGSGGSAARGGGDTISISPGAIVINGAGQNAEEIANLVIQKFSQARAQKGYRTA
jgi:TP901 family phage tail tape measure protein